MSGEKLRLENIFGSEDCFDYFDDALIYRNASTVLREFVREEVASGYNESLYHLKPYIILCSFSSELYLKGILRKENIIYNRSHDLNTLFSLLDEFDKGIIIEETKKIYFSLANNDDKDYCFESYLNNISNAFITWRYSMEETKDILEINLSFLAAFCESLNKWVQTNITLNI